MQLSSGCFKRKSQAEFDEEQEHLKEAHAQEPLSQSSYAHTEQSFCLLGLVSQGQIDSDDITFLDEIVHLGKLAAQLLLLVIVQVLVVKVQNLFALKRLHNSLMSAQTARECRLTPDLSQIDVKITTDFHHQRCGKDHTSKPTQANSRQLGKKTPRQTDDWHCRYVISCANHQT